MAEHDTDLQRRGISFLEPVSSTWFQFVNLVFNFLSTIILFSIDISTVEGRKLHFSS